jgi:amino acid adenylation domain-containing protein
VDLRELRDEDKENRARELYRAYAHKAFNLERGPLFLFKLVRLKDDEYLFISNIHHIINDGWSQAIIKREILDLYNDFLQAKVSSLPPIKLQYKDYANWQNRLIDGFEREAGYWWEKFKDKPNGIELPLDHPRKPVQTFNGSQVKFTMDGETTSQLHAFCLEREVTPFMGLLALLDIFLYKYSGQRDMIIGLPIAGRRGDELQHIVGFLVNTLVFRVELAPGETAVQLLERVGQETLSCYRNQDYPFDLLVDRLELDRDLSQSPLFNVMLAHNNLEIRGIELAADHIEIGPYPYAHDVNMSKFDLLFFMDEVGEQIDVRLEYNSDLFEANTVQRMANNFLTLMGNVLHNPGKPIWSLDCIGPSEYRTIVQGFNDNEEVFPSLTVQELFEQQAAKTPDHIAVAAPKAHITYRELNKKANRLAHYLREEFSVIPGDIIGLSMDRSLEMIMALLGIMKSGAVYMALDPAYPANRISYMLADSQTKLVIVDQSRPGLFSGYKGNVIDIGADWHAVVLKSPENPETINRLTDISYVTYTSGSTGIPNGAAVSHHMLTNLIQWQKEKTGIDGSLRCLQFTSISFDVSFQEIMSTLTAGGGLVLIGEMERKDADYLMDFLCTRGIEVLYLPFYYLNFLFREGRWLESVGHCLKHIVTAGEQLIMTPGLKSFLQSNPRVRLHNHYGPAEMHVVTSFTLTASTAGDWHLPPIGRPIANVGIYILDEHDRPIPIGVWGEICIGGPSSFVGYVNKPQLTRRKLLVEPALGGDNRGLYRTGDIGRWQEDGNIELKGRKDFQVKIRGFRVEPGEIESKLLSIDNIRDCVVVVKEDARHQDYLAAYIVVKDEIEMGDIRRLLSRDLPQYMIPRLTVLESLPLLPNGKVDRARLPEPGIDSGEQYAAPGNEIEKKLVGLWAEVLGIEAHQIGIYDNFFQLGGHSLKATALTTKIHKAFNVKVPLTKVFKTPSVKELSEYLKGAAAERFPIIEPVEKRDYYPLSSAQKRLYYLQQIELQSTNYNMPAALVLEGKLNKEKMETAFKTLIRRHESLRTSFQMVGVEAVQRIHEGAEFEIEYTVTEDTEKREIIQNSFIRPFDLSQAPLLRVGLIKEKEERHLLMVDMHHIISDGASLEVFLTDFTAFYSAGELLPLPIQYKDFSWWQDKFNRGEQLVQQETYWLQQFEGGIPLLRLPLDYERPPVKSSRGRVLEFETGEDAARALQELARDEDATLFMVLAALYNILLAKISNMEDIVIGTAAAGREHPDLQPIIGMFVNTLVLRNFPSGRETFREFLHQVKTRCLEAFNNQDYPFEDLVDKVTGSRETNRNPIFDAGFSLQNKSIVSGDVPEVDGRALGLTLKPHPIDAGMSKFDLQLYAFETAANIRFNLEYCTDLFKHETIELMGRYFLNILGAVITNPGVSIKDIEIIGTEQKKEILTQMKRKRGMSIDTVDEDTEKARNKQADFDF